jgi:hypothetical protein
MTIRILQGDCAEVMKTLADSVTRSSRPAVGLTRRAAAAYGLGNLMGQGRARVTTASWAAWDGMCRARRCVC